VPLADFILVVHFLFALFVVGSLPLIWIGAWMGLGFVRNLRFRLAHLLAILFVAGESLVGMVCPLTSLEDALRGTGNAASFVQRWLQRILYYDLPEWILTVGYVMFALLVACTFVIVPPSRGKVRR
jgi:polyferredoxin